MPSYDFLVIGSGIAGLTYALDVAALGRVAVLCKRDPSEGNTLYAQGGIASVTDEDDSFEAHVRDTLVAGAGLCHEHVVRLVVTAAPRKIADLTRFGVVFDRQDGIHFDLAKEGGHSNRRILHAGDATGAEIQRALLNEARKHPQIEFIPDHIAVDFIFAHEPSDNGPRRITGCYALDERSGEIVPFTARITMLASGGAGKVYLYTSNPDVATGDGIAMAYRAGAEIGNMEFIQFHPTCLYHPEAKSFLITEALRGEGAILKTIRGERFMPHYHPDAELAPRDVVARAIDDQMKKSGDEYVLLDISHKDPDFIRHRFPTIYARTRQLGFDMTKSPLPVVPAAHYCCGGVITDTRGQTSLPGLFCAGEAACTGLHGANRLASNSLLEAIVFAEQAAEAALAEFTNAPPPGAAAPWDYAGSVESPEQVLVAFAWDEVRRLMWNLVGIVRSDRRLLSARERIQLIKKEVREYYWKFRPTPDVIELRNLVDVAEIIVAAAAFRKETRGLHYTVDHPLTDDQRWHQDTVVISGGADLPVCSARTIGPSS